VESTASHQDVDQTALPRIPQTVFGRQAKSDWTHGVELSKLFALGGGLCLVYRTSALHAKRKYARGVGAVN